LAFFGCRLAFRYFRWVGFCLTISIATACGLIAKVPVAPSPSYLPRHARHFTASAIAGQARPLPTAHLRMEFPIWTVGRGRIPFRQKRLSEDARPPPCLHRKQGGCMVEVYAHSTPVASHQVLISLFLRTRNVGQSNQNDR
jgi:hypothetical protein